MLTYHVPRYSFQPSARPNSTTDYVSIHIYSHVDGNRNVVILSEIVDDYSGMSVTNGSPYIIKKLLEEELVKEEDVFVEIYPTGARGKDSKESFDVIRYKNNHGNLSVKWAPFSRGELEHIISESF